MEEKRFRILFQPELQDFEDIVALHAKVGKGAMVKANNVANIILLVVGVVLILDAAVLIFLERALSTTSIFALAFGAFALIYFIYKRRLSAIMMRKNNEKYMKKQEIFIDADGIRAQTDQAEAHYQFGAVEEIYFWRNNYVLYLDKNRVLPLPLGGFLEGDPKEFGDYISKQCGLPVQTPADKKNKEH